MLTGKGVRYVRQFLRAVARASAGKLSTADGEPVATRRLRPRWDAGQGCLWLGEELLHEFEKSAPAIFPFLDAFEATGWTPDSLPIPLERQPGETDAEFRARTENTVKNLNRTLRHTAVHFRLTRDREGIRYEFLQNRNERPGGPR